MKLMKRTCLGLAFLMLTVAPLGGLARSSEERPATETVETRLDPRPVIFTAINIPARAALCGLNSWLASIFMAFSAGMRYADAAHMTEEGCFGPWVITPEMIEQAGAPKKSPPSAVWRLDHPGEFR